MPTRPSPKIRVHGELGIPAGIRAYVQVKLPGDEPEHPYGQWSAVYEGGCMQLIAEEAPSPKVGDEVSFYRGPRLLGRATVVGVGI